MDKKEEKTVLLSDDDEIVQDNPPPYQPQNHSVSINTKDGATNLADSRLGYPNRSCSVSSYYHSSDKHCHVVIDHPVTAQISIQPSEYRLHSWVGYAICVTLCCCIPTGLCAIFTAVKANDAASAGEIQKAQSRSRLSRNLIIVSLVLGIGLWLFIIYNILSFSYELVHNDWGHNK